MENNKMKLSINPKLIILICIVLLIILVLIMLLAGNKEKEQQPTQPPAPTKIEITNELMNQLDRKINLLKYNNYCEIGNNTNYYMYDCLYRQELTTVDDLSETYRLYTLVLAKDKNMESKINYVVGNIVVDNYKFRYTQQFSVEEFNEEYYYDGELGALYSDDKTTFRVWSPVSSKIVLKVYENGTPTSIDATLGSDVVYKEVEMTKKEKGVFEAVVEENLEGIYLKNVKSLSAPINLY